MKPTPNNALKVAIVLSGWTTQDVARRSRIHPTRLGSIKSGRIIPNDSEQRRLARVLDTTVDHLFGSEVAA